MEIEIKNNYDEFRYQIKHFVLRYDGAYLGMFGLDPAKFVKLKKMSELFEFCHTANGYLHDFSSDMAKYTARLFHGPADQPLGPIPSLPAYPAVLPEVTDPDAFSFFSGCVQDCKRSPAFTTNVAADLGVLKGSTTFDPESGKPIIKTKTAEGGHPLLHVKKGQYQGWELWKDRNDGKGFVKLKEVMHSDYLDNDPLPALGNSVVWKYKAIYIFKDKHAGNWSDGTTVTVYGSV